MLPELAPFLVGALDGGFLAAAPLSQGRILERPEAFRGGPRERRRLRRAEGAPPQARDPALTPRGKSWWPGRLSSAGPLLVLVLVRPAVVSPTGRLLLSQPGIIRPARIRTFRAGDWRQTKFSIRKPILSVMILTYSYFIFNILQRFLALLADMGPDASAGTLAHHHHPRRHRASHFVGPGVRRLPRPPSGRRALARAGGRGASLMVIGGALRH